MRLRRPPAPLHETQAEPRCRLESRTRGPPGAQILPNVDCSRLDAIAPPRALCVNGCCHFRCYRFSERYSAGNVYEGAVGKRELGKAVRRAFSAQPKQNLASTHVHVVSFVLVMKESMRLPVSVFKS